MCQRVFHWKGSVMEALKIDPEPARSLTFDEMIKSGVIQEANRQFFHPLGLRMCLYDCERTESNFLEVRFETAGKDIESFELMHESELKTRAENVASMRERYREARAKLYNGDIIQPIPE